MSGQANTHETQLSYDAVLQAGTDFLEHFGVEVGPLDQPNKFPEAMSQLDPRYDGGRDLVRYELEADHTVWPAKTKNVIMDTAEAMRMLEPETPLIGSFTVVVALGGARQANLDRVRYAAEAGNSDQATFMQLVAVGSARELKDAEQQATSNYAPSASTEFDLIAGAVRTVTEENPGLIIGEQFVKDPKAGTPDVIHAVLNKLWEVGLLSEDSRVGAVTTQIYQVSTALDLGRVASRFDISDTYTAGNPSDPKIVDGRTTATYLSEVLRTLKAAANSAVADDEYIRNFKE